MTDIRLIANSEAGSSVRAKLNFDRAAVYNVQDFGWLPDGTDHSTQALAILTAIDAAGGGTIYFPPSTGVYRADSQLLIPNNAASIPDQVNIRFTGAGGGTNWGNGPRTSVGASVLDLRYQAVDGNAKIESRGAGALVINNLTFKDGGSSNATPFVHVTNTTVTIRGNLFKGSGSATQDAIVLGGASNQTPGSGVTAPFQGYGSIIDSNQFIQLNRGIYGRTFSNSVIVTNNSWLASTGTRAIEFASTTGNSADVITGCYIVGNIIEMSSPMVYGVVLQGALNCFCANSFYDAGGAYVSDYRLVAASSGASWRNVFVNMLSAGTIVTQTGDATQLTLSTFIGALGNTNLQGDGVASNQFAKGAEVLGTWNASNGAAGSLNIRDEFAPSELLCFGAGSEANIDAWDNGGFNRVLNVQPRGGPFTVNGPLVHKPTAVTLANGLNSNINLYAADATAKSSYTRITGPTGAFSIGGFYNKSNATSSVVGSVLKVYNSTAQTMTIINEDASSAAGNRIKTLTGGNVALRATATSFATFIYDTTDTRWILESTN